MAACLPSFQGLVPATPVSPTAFVELSPAAQPTATRASTPSVSSTAAFTPIPSFTATAVSGFTVTPGVTGTAPAPTQPAATGTAESVSLDKLPPSTVYKRIRIQNQSHSQMDISLHCTTIHGLHTVLEYNNVKNLAVQAPEGDYIYVLYVGGRPMSGSFSLLGVPAVTITVYADRVAIH